MIRNRLKLFRRKTHSILQGGNDLCLVLQSPGFVAPLGNLRLQELALLLQISLVGLLQLRLILRLLGLNGTRNVLQVLVSLLELHQGSVVGRWIFSSELFPINGSELTSQSALKGLHPCIDLQQLVRTLTLKPLLLGLKGF